MAITICDENPLLYQLNYQPSDIWSLLDEFQKKWTQLEVEQVRVSNHIHRPNVDKNPYMTILKTPAKNIVLGVLSGFSDEEENQARMDINVFFSNLLHRSGLPTWMLGYDENFFLAHYDNVLMIETMVQAKLTNEDILEYGLGTKDRFGNDMNGVLDHSCVYFQKVGTTNSIIPNHFADLLLNIADAEASVRRIQAIFEFSLSHFGYELIDLGAIFDRRTVLCSELSPMTFRINETGKPLQDRQTTWDDESRKKNWLKLRDAIKSK